MRVACSEGTYVRTLCHDLGAALGMPAHMGALVREASGPFVLYEARTLEEIARAPERALIAPEHIIPFPTIVLDLRGSADFRAGRVVPLPEGATGTARVRARRVAHAGRRRRGARDAARAAQGLPLKVRHELVARHGRVRSRSRSVSSTGFIAATVRSRARPCACAGPAGVPAY